MFSLLIGALLALMSPINASVSCPETGWVLAIGHTQTQQVMEIAEGPLPTWIDSGWLNQAQITVKVDSARFAEGILILRFTRGQETDQLEMRQFSVEGSLRCGYRSAVDSDGDIWMFTNQIKYQNHLHSDVRLLPHAEEGRWF